MADIEIKIDLDTKNDAFVDNMETEVYHILQKAVLNIDVNAVGNTVMQKLYDYNGNHVGNIQTRITADEVQPMPHDEAIISG